MSKWLKCSIELRRTAAGPFANMTLNRMSSIKKNQRNRINLRALLATAIANNILSYFTMDFVFLLSIGEITTLTYPKLEVYVPIQ